MKKLKRLTKSIQPLNKRNKIILIAAVLLLATIPISAFALSHPNQPKSTKITVTKKNQPKVAAANTQSNQLQLQPSPSDQQTPATGSTANKPTSSPAVNNSANQPSSFPLKKSSQAPSPPPPLVYGVTINKTSLTETGPGQFEVPFTITIYQGRFSHMTYNAGIISSPSPGTQCSPVMHLGNTGVLQVHLSQTAADGQYICRLTLNADNSIVTDQFSFTVTDNSVSLP